MHFLHFGCRPSKSSKAEAMLENYFQLRLEQPQTFSKPNTPCTCTRSSQRLNQDWWAGIRKKFLSFLRQIFPKKSTFENGLHFYHSNEPHCSYIPYNMDIKNLLTKFIRVREKHI